VTAPVRLALIAALLLAAALLLGCPTAASAGVAAGYAGGAK